MHIETNNNLLEVSANLAGKQRLYCFINNVLSRIQVDK